MSILFLFNFVQFAQSQRRDRTAKFSCGEDQLSSPRNVQLLHSSPSSTTPGNSNTVISLSRVKTPAGNGVIEHNVVAMRGSNEIWISFSAPPQAPPQGPCLFSPVLRPSDFCETQRVKVTASVEVSPPVCRRVSELC